MPLQHRGRYERTVTTGYVVATGASTQCAHEAAAAVSVHGQVGLRKTQQHMIAFSVLDQTDDAMRGAL